MKRIVSILIAFSLFVSTVGVMAKEEAIYINEVFDNYITNELPPSITQEGDGGVRVTELTQMNKGLVLPVRSLGSSAEFKLAEVAEEFVISLEIQRDTDTAAAISIGLVANEMENTILSYERGCLYTHNGKEIGAIASKTFTKVDILYNKQSNRYHVLINGRNVASNMLYSRELHTITALKISAQMRDEPLNVLVDNVRVYSGNTLCNQFPAKPYNPKVQEWEEAFTTQSVQMLVQDDYESSRTSLSVNKKINSIEYVKEDSGNTYLKMNKFTAEDIYMDYSHKTQTRYMNIEFDIMLPEPGALGGMMLRDSARVYSNLFRILADGTFVFVPNGRMIPQVSSRAWTKIAANVDLASKTVSLYVNGEETYTDIPMENVNTITSDISIFRIQLTSGNYQGSLGLDNLKIYTGKKPLTQEEFEQEASAPRPSPFPDNSRAIRLLSNNLALQTGSGAIYANKTKKNINAKVISKNGVALVAARAVGQMLDLPVSWDESTGTITLGDNITIAVGAAGMQVGGEEKPLEHPAFLDGETSYIPIGSVVKDALGKHYLYDDYRGLVLISDEEITLSAQEINTVNAYLLYDRPDAQTIREDFFAKNPTKSHPRLMATPQDFARVKQTIQTNDLVKGWVDDLIRTADYKLTAATAQYILAGKRLLTQSRLALSTFKALAFAYQMTGDQKYVDRAWKEIEAVGSFPDWNPPHFLDVAEMMAGVSIAYDWMYDGWTEQQRNYIEEIVVRHGINPSKEALYIHWFNTTNNNWNIVCNGAIALAALTFFESDPELYSHILSLNMRSSEYLFDEFAPDGGYEEGPGYWHFCLRYVVKFFSALDTAMGTNYNISNAKGLSSTADYILHADSTVGVNNYHDAVLTHFNPSSLLYLGDKYNNPGVISAKLRKNELLNTEISVYDPIFYKDTSITAAKIDLPLDGYFKNTEFFAMRNSWEAEQDAYLSAHGGKLAANHYHVDSGSFVYYSMGERWALDIGTDDITYNINYSIRDDIYRVRAEGHNVMVINPDEGPGMDIDSFCPIEEFVSKERGAYTVMDLTPAYKEHVSSYRRGYMMGDDRRSVTVRDEVSLNKKSEIYWFMHTSADVKIIDSHTAVLTQNGKQMQFDFTTNAGVYELSVMEAKALPTSPTAYQSQEADNSAFRKIAIRMEANRNLTVETRMIPLGDPVSNMPLADKPLKDWSIPDGEIVHLPKLEMIYANGEPIKGFNPNSTGYKIPIPQDGNTLPVITAEAGAFICKIASDNQKSTITVSRADDPTSYNVYMVEYERTDMRYRMENYQRYEVVDVVASEVPQTENAPENILDDNLATRWSAEGKGQWISIYLGELKEIDAIAIAFYSGNSRTYDFVLEASDDGIEYTKIYEGSSKSTDNYEIILLQNPIKARYIRYKGNGSNVNEWNSVLELGALVKK